MELRGKIYKIFDTVKISDTFKKREFILKTEENPLYPELLKLEFIKDKCTLLDSFKGGDEVIVLFNIKGREWENKNGEIVYFNTLQAWKVNAIEHGSSREGAELYSQRSVEDDEADSLPF